MFGQTVTIYNEWFDRASRETLWPKTVIAGASWSGRQHVTTGDGLASDDGYSVRVPKDAMPEGFVERDEFAALPNPEGFWTAQDGDVVVLGEGPDVEGGITEVTSRRTDCFVVTAVRTDSLRRLLPHLRMEGK
jgi:hypothetical protein